MDKKALQLASRFALPPNSFGYCGKDTAPEKFKCCVIDGACGDVENEITKFIVLNPYLQTIGTLLNKSPFSYDVIESYWLGNDYLKEIESSGYSLLLDNFIKQGVPEWLVEELKSKPPKKFIPTHLFQVLHVGVGKASGSVPYNLETINNCMARWGTVVRIKGNMATVKLNSLDKNKKAYKLSILEETHQFIPEFVKTIKKGDTVAVHWKQVVKILNKREVETITKWTNQVIENIPYQA